MKQDTLTPTRASDNLPDPCDPPGGTRTSVNIDLVGSAPEQHGKVIRAAGVLLEKVIAKPEFRRKVEAAKYTGGTQFRERSGKVIQVPNEKIADIIEQGIERDTSADYQLDMKIVPHNHRRGVVGSATLGKGPIRPAVWFLNRCVDKKDTISLARHLLHEWLHVAGFFHKRNGPNQDDVPYQVGNIVREIAKDTNLRSELVGAGFNEEYLQEDQEAASYLEYYEDEVDFGDEQEWWSWVEDDDLWRPSSSTPE